MKHLTDNEIEYLAKEYIDNNFDIRTYTLRDIRESYKDGYKDCQDTYQPRPIEELGEEHMNCHVILYNGDDIQYMWLTNDHLIMIAKKSGTHFLIIPRLKTN